MNQLKNFPYKRALVLGLAKSGTAAAQLLLDHGVSVIINDFKASATDPAVIQLKKQGAQIVLGTHPLTVLDGVDVLVKNPGIPYENPLVKAATERGLPIITEIELAGDLAPGRLIGVTGSNGKTTTTTLIGEMLLQSGCHMKLAGNIGTVATEVARSLTKDEIMVTELSSFQLLGTQSFRPHIAIMLNIFEAHLDYHHTMTHYMSAKQKIMVNQTSEDYLVYNADDEKVVALIQDAQAIRVPFSIQTKEVTGAWIDEHSLYFQEEKIIALTDIVLVGAHNIENILAAVSAAKISGATNEGIRQVLSTFTGVKHRLQFVTTRVGRLFYNDSKATNILATEKALLAFEQPTILLAGGLDRGNAFDALIPSLKNVKAMIVFGETAEKLKQTAEKAGIEQIVAVANMNEAVQAAYRSSLPGDVILLSPACASWDQYKTFEERGELFIKSVRDLRE